MNMATSNDRRDFRRQLFFSLGGIAVGIAVAGLLALLINNVIEPTMQVETQDLVEFPGDTFSIWYHIDSPNVNSRHELLPRLEENLSDLLVQLDVSIDAIPLPIDVLVHDSPEMMQQITLRRKSGRAMYSFYSVIDLLQDEDPFPRMAELVLAFGWGRCSSQLLYKGMLMNVSSPDRDFHVPLAAAPLRLLHSVDDLLMLERIDTFGETLYQRYQSPYSPRMAMGTFESIGEFRTMIASIGDEAAEYGIAELQAGSLVQYLIECAGGQEAFRAIWGPGTSEALISRLTCGPVTELFGDWMTVIQSADSSSPEFASYQARFLFEAGDIEAAAMATEAWLPNNLSSSDSVLAVRTQLAVGDFEGAARFAAAADRDTLETLESWVAIYSDWGQASDDRVTVLGYGTSESLDELLQKVRTAYDFAGNFLGFTEDELPEHISVFYYDSDEAAAIGDTVLPVVSIHRTIWNISSQDNMVEEFTVTLPSFVTKKKTASNLLTRGLRAIVTIDRNELVARGCEMLQSGEWTPLWRVGFGGVPDRLFETQTGLMIGFIVDTYGIDVIRDLWVATARIGGGVSLDTAIKNSLESSRSEIEGVLVDSVLVCE